MAIIKELVEDKIEVVGDHMLKDMLSFQGLFIEKLLNVYHHLIILILQIGLIPIQIYLESLQKFKVFVMQFGLLQLRMLRKQLTKQQVNEKRKRKRKINNHIQLECANNHT